MVERFNLRAYGLLVRDRRLLISSEIYQGHHLVKFPGGGVEYEEGVKDALIREWQEEIQGNIRVGDLLYVTDYFLPSAFRKEDQILCFYYWVYTEETVISKRTEHELGWADLLVDGEPKFTFPQEKMVYGMVKKRFRIDY